MITDSYDINRELEITHRGLSDSYLCTTCDNVLCKEVNVATQISGGMLPLEQMRSSDAHGTSQTRLVTEKR